MKCPYCSQDHPDEISHCPETGEPLAQFTFESTQASQLPMQPEIETRAQAEETPGTQAQEHTETPLAQISQEAENPSEQGTPLAQMDSQLASAVSSEPDAAHPSEVVAESSSEKKTTKPQRTFPWVIGGCAGILVIILLLLALVVLVDPFNWHVLGRVNGNYDAAAEVMPADTGMYLGINIASALVTRIDRSVEPFIPNEQTEQTNSGKDYLSAPINPRYAQASSPIDNLLQQIENSTGIRIPEDVSPWVGQYAGVGIMDFEGADYGTPFPANWMIAIEARNLHRADTFLETLQTNLTEINDLSFDRQTYKKVNIITQKAYGSQYGTSFGRMGKMVIIASSLDTIKKAIDRQADQALSAEKDYTALVSLRSSSWSASLYINHGLAGSLTDEIMNSSTPAGTSLINPYANLIWNSMLVNVTAIRQGLRFDVYTDMAATSQSAETSLLQFVPPEQLLRILPQDTVAYMASTRFDMTAQALINLAFSDEYGKNNFLQSFEQSFGFSLQEDLINQLTGPWAVFVVPSRQGLLPTQADLNLAITLLVQTEGDMDLQPITAGLKNLSPMSGISVNQQEQAGITYYEIGNSGYSAAMFAFGAGNSYFTLGTDLDELRVSASDENTLLQSASYQGTIKSFPAGMQPYLYFDLENLLANLREGMEASELESFNESIRYIESVGVISLSTRILQPNVVQSSLVVILADQ
jgi:hypothetical protein